MRVDVSGELVKPSTLRILIFNDYRRGYHDKSGSRNLLWSKSTSQSRISIEKLFRRQVVADLANRSKT